MPTTLLIVTTILFAPSAGGFADLEEALSAVEARKPLSGRVSTKVADAALAEIQNGAGELAALLRIAKAGRVGARLTPALVRRLTEKADALTLRELARRPAQELTAQRKQLGSVLTEALEEPRLASPAARLVGRLEPARNLIRDYLRPWSTPDEGRPPAWASQLVRGLGESSRRLETLSELLVFSDTLPPKLERTLTASITRLARSPKAAELLLRHLGSPRPPSRLFAALSGLKGVHLKKAQERLGALLDGGRASLPVVEAGIRLRVPKLGSRLLVVATRARTAEARAAALRSLGGALEGASPELVRRAKAAVLDALRTPNAPLIRAAAISAAVRLRLPTLQADLLVCVRGPADPRVRREALRYLSVEVDADLLKLLVPLLKDRVLARDAWLTLKRLTKLQLPMRFDVWESWRLRQGAKRN